MIMLAAAQMASTSSPWENLKEMESLARLAREAGSEAVCFPECALTGYDLSRGAEASLPADCDVLKAAGELAKNLDIDLLIGYMERQEAGLFIAHGLFRRDGSREVYRKTHLGKKESTLFLPGDRLPVFSLSCGVRVGVQLCLESHYPDITRTLAQRGAEVVFSPHAAGGDGAGREALWRKYIPARAYDNRLYVCCCNQSGGRFHGGYLVASPEGEVLSAGFGAESYVVYFSVDRGHIADYRADDGPRRRWYLPSRRRELYEP